MPALAPRSLRLVACLALLAAAAAPFTDVGSVGAPCDALKLTTPVAVSYGHLGQAQLSNASVVAAMPAIGPELGVLLVFERTTGDLQFRLQPADAGLGDGFGKSVAVRGCDALVGAPDKALHGAAYVFDVKVGEERLTLLPPDPQTNMLFGASVAIAGRHLVVGAPGYFPYPPNAGAVYVYDRRTGELRWRLAPADLTFGFFDDAFFGTSVAVDGRRLIAGAPGDATIGSARLFDAVTGAQLHKLLPPASPAPEGFGWSVDIDGDLIAVGDLEADGNRGAAHVLDADSGQLLFTVQAPDGGPGDGFGVTVAVDREYLAVGAVWDKDGPSTGSVYLFRVSNGQLITKLHGFPAATTMRFGASLQLHAGTLAVGDPEDSEAVTYGGAAYVVPLAACP